VGKKKNFYVERRGRGGSEKRKDSGVNTSGEREKLGGGKHKKENSND